MTVKDVRNVAAGVILKLASLKCQIPLENLTSTARRTAVRLAIGSIYNDATLFGVVGFDRHNQNNGRDAAIIQTIAERNDTSTYHTSVQVVLPERYASELRQPFIDWESRFGCPAGSFNTANDCRACP